MIEPATELKPCPFCGSSFAPVVADSAEAMGFDDDGFLQDWTVVCDYTNGGCGASSGWVQRRLEAPGRWNRRDGEALL